MNRTLTSCRKSHTPTEGFSIPQMTSHPRAPFLRALCVMSFAFLFAFALPGTAFAQDKPSEGQPSHSKSCEAATTAAARHECFEANSVIQTHYLTHAFQQSDANEILIALRNALGMDVKLFLVASQNAIVVSAPPDQQELAQKIISELDRPHKTYRLTYTLAESDAGKRIGVQHFSMVVAAGQRVTLKQGNKVPVMTGSFDSKADSQQTQFQYLDIGMNFDATLTDSPGGLLLKSGVEQSSLADEHMSGPLAPEPIVRQTSLQGTSVLTPGKPLTLGSLDVAGSTRHLDIEVVAEPIS